MMIVFGFIAINFLKNIMKPKGEFEKVHSKKQVPAVGKQFKEDNLISNDGFEKLI